MSETDLVKAIVDLVTIRGGVPLRINSGVRVIPGENDGKDRVFRGAPAGTSDIIALYQGVYLAIECKAGKNMPTPKQEEFLARVVEAGGVAVVARSIDFMDSVLVVIVSNVYSGARYDESVPIKPKAPKKAK
jgi:hypothetical protein